MTEQEFINLVKTNLGLSLDDIKLNLLEIYCNYLIEYNKNVNLTAIKDKKDIYLKHFYDSLTLVKVTDLNQVNNLLDIGTGAGFPGMVLKIIFPHLKVTLLDSNNKKIKFLKSLSQKLGIEVNLINDRAEIYAKKHLEEFDIVTSRAVAELPILIELSIPYLKKHGLFIALKSKVNQELDASKKIIKDIKCNVEKVYNFNLPILNHERTIVVIKKCEKTQKKYPRNYSEILKDIK